MADQSVHHDQSVEGIGPVKRDRELDVRYAAECFLEINIQEGRSEAKRMRQPSRDELYNCIAEKYEFEAKKK